MKECIILAGGMGTRLKSIISDLPKCMAPINGKPFLFYILEWLKKNNFERVILSLGYKSEVIIDFTKENTWPFEILWVIEKEPLGTGGAICLSLGLSKSSNIFIINGDTFFDIDIMQFYKCHLENEADLSIAAKPLINYNRYGSLVCDNNDRIIGFTEKKPTVEGIINGGIYLLKSTSILLSEKTGRFSFETDILEKEYSKSRLFAFRDDGYFIDIGIPEDYHKAEIDFKVFFG